ncbi:MAG: YbaK/EbsC family protein [Pirellulales bacterium]|jgi:Ala-tRNA(Pro) deacylase|nr:YbaK/EbsC family protein [Thermoguttaceae bacterium]MDD4786680.1 YbaK/EbsC family protein [Pirellulales bacterium]NLZ00546.1 YbaK/EbsC family protein [Pirellulaceae bacterium]
MPANKLKRFLDENHIRYISIRHSPAYTAQETAASAHIPGKEVIKTVMLYIDGELAMAVLPSTRMLDLELLRHVADAESVTLATENQFKDRFPDCEAGAMPPFGNLYEMPVYVDRSVTLDEQIAFNAGSHAELIQLDYGDYERLVHPIIAEFAYMTKARV